MKSALKAEQGRMSEIPENRRKGGGEIERIPKKIHDGQGTVRDGIPEERAGHMVSYHGRPGHPDDGPQGKDHL